MLKPGKETDREKADRLITGMAETLRPLVENIEAARPVTQNHYGRYLEIMLTFEDVLMRKAVYMALSDAGANPQGVNAAARLAW